MSVAETERTQVAPSATLPVEQAALQLVSDLCWNLDDNAHPIDRYLRHAYWRSVVQQAAKLLTGECGSDLAILADEGMKPAQIRAMLASQGVELTDDGVSHLIKVGRKAKQH